MIIFLCLDSSRNQNFRKVFQGAQMVGLFPVTGLKSIPESNETIEFRPISFRLLATVMFIFAVIVLEGLGLLHMLLFSQNEDSYLHGRNVMNSNFAPVLHYGTTVRLKQQKNTVSLFVSTYHL